MVDVFGKAAFLTRQLSQATMAAECAEPLQLVSEASVSVAHVSDRLAGVDFPIAIGCDVGHARVDPKHVINIEEVKFLDLARYQQIPIAAMEQQIAFTLASGKHAPLTFAAHEPYRLSPEERPDRNGRIGQSKREDAVIVGNRGKRAKGALGLLVELVGIADLGKRTHDHLRRQTKLLAHLLIAQLLERKFAEALPLHF
jgi:hypothetical protein